MTSAEKIKSLGKSFVVLAVVPSSKLPGEIKSSAKKLCEDSLAGILITSSKPYNAAKKALKSPGIDVEKIFFIDCVTAGITEAKRSEGVLYVKGPADLVGIGISVNEFIDGIPGSKFLILDSLKTLGLYNKETNIERFTESLVKKCKKASIRAIVFTSPEDKNLKAVEKYFDKVLK